MAKLPDGFSLQALPIEAALSEGRTSDAVRLIIEILRAGSADKVVQKLAAEMISPTIKNSRGRRKTLPQHWFDIAQEFHSLRGSGMRYEDVIVKIEKTFRYSERHILNAVKEYDAAKAAADEESRT
jgi:hypothetical protein